MSNDPLFTSFKDNLSTNPRYETMYNLNYSILDRVNDKLRTNDDCDSGKRGVKDMRVQKKRVQIQIQVCFHS
jgi:hypothetical protein